METQPKWKLLLKSRKFWAAVVGLGLVVLRFYLPSFPLSDEDVTRLVYLLIAYILGTALEDGLVTRMSAPAPRQGNEP